MEANEANEAIDVCKTQSYRLGTVGEMQLDPEMERKTLRKFDMCLLPQIAVLIIIGYLDRTNIGECPDLQSPFQRSTKLT